MVWFNFGCSQTNGDQIYLSLPTTLLINLLKSFFDGRVPDCAKLRLVPRLVLLHRGRAFRYNLFPPPAGGGKGFSLQSLTLAPQDHFPSANLNTKYSILNGI